MTLKHSRTKTDHSFSMVSFIIFGALAGLCLICWAAAKAFGGMGGFGMIIDCIGIAALPFWILAPLLNYALRPEKTGSPRSLLLLIPAILAIIRSFKLLKQRLMAGQGLPEGRGAKAVASMWILSLSSIYVFLP